MTQSKVPRSPSPMCSEIGGPRTSFPLIPCMPIRKPYFNIKYLTWNIVVRANFVGLLQMYSVKEFIIYLFSRIIQKYSGSNNLFRGLQCCIDSHITPVYIIQCVEGHEHLAKIYTTVQHHHYLPLVFTHNAVFTQPEAIILYTLLHRTAPTGAT
jgi:hypothetical protein